MRFVQQSPRDFYKPPVVLEIMAAGAFGDIRTNTVGAPHNLLADSVPGKPVPMKNGVPNLVCQFFSQLVNPKFSKFVLPINCGIAEFDRFRLLTSDY